MSDAIALAAAIAAREVSAVEVVKLALQRIDSTNGQINAFTEITATRALSEAAEIDARLARREAVGPLAGVPYAVKNLFDIEGVVTLAGSKVNRVNPAASEDATLIRRMGDAGAVLVGALNMDEYAYGFTTENTHYGACRNPHDLRRIAGGSSGGSGASVAAAQVPISLGSDTNGSIRVPASLCGIWGLKPTFGRLSRHGSFPFVHSLDHLGALANTLRGLALTYDALQGPDSRDSACLAQRHQPVIPHLGRGTHDLRIGVLGGYFDSYATVPAQKAAAQAGAVLGATDKVNWPFADVARAAAFIITASEGGSLHLDHLRSRSQDFEPLSVDRFIAGALQPAAWYLRAQRFRSVYRDAVLDLFKRWDVLIAPATPVQAPLIGTEWLDVNGNRLPCRAAMGLLTQPISFAGCPVVTAPMWPDANSNGAAGLPLGVQLIAAPWREDLAFRAAEILAESGTAYVSPTLA